MRVGNLLLPKSNYWHFFVFSSGEMPSGGITKVGDGKFFCTVCGNTFNDCGNAKRHFRLRHTTQTPQKCHICKKVYKNDVSLFNHTRSAHGITKGMAKGLGRSGQQVGHIKDPIGSGDLWTPLDPTAGPYASILRD